VTRVEPLAMALVPVSMSRVPSFPPQPARTSAQSKADRTRIGPFFPFGAGARQAPNTAYSGGGSRAQRQAACTEAAGLAYSERT
jgi:hypothetical protein